MSRIQGSTGVIIAGDNATIKQRISLRERDAVEDIDLGKLARELNQLRSAMKNKSSNSDHDIAVAEVARAERAAIDGDRSTVAQHLTEAGRWALELAKELSLHLAANAIEKSGLG